MLSRAAMLPLSLFLLLPPGATRPMPPKPAVEAEKFDLDFAHSAVEFNIRFMGLTNVRGRFDEYSGTLMYQERDLTRSTVSVIIKTRSIDTGVKFRDKDLMGESFFDAEKYPDIRFQSSRIEQTGNGFVASGPFSLHGVTRELAIPFTRLHDKMSDGWGNTRIGFVGGVTLNRKDYGISGSNFWNQMVDLRRMALGDSVQVELSIEGVAWNYDKWTFPSDQKPAVGDTLMKVIASQGVKPALQLYQALKRDHADEYTIGEAQLNLVGYKLLGQGRLEEAIEVFKLNVSTFPQSANVYDSMGEAYSAHGDRDLAIQSYAKSLEMNPENTSAAEMLRWLKP